MSTIPVDKAVPMPAEGLPRRVGPVPKYPWRTMQVGDSFALPHTERQRRILVRAASSQKQTSGLEFRVLVVMEDGAKVIRTWRIK